MPLSECIRRHTHREYVTWLAWLDEQWNQPDRTDHYLMQIAHCVRQQRAAHPEQLSLRDEKIMFEQRGQRPAKKLSREEWSQRAKATWRARLHGNKKHHDG